MHENEIWNLGENTKIVTITREERERDRCEFLIQGYIPSFARVARIQNIFVKNPILRIYLAEIGLEREFRREI